MTEAEKDNTLKIIVTYKDEKSTVGVSKPGCDPRLSLVVGTLPEVLMQVPELVEQAEAAWTESPRYAKCETKITPPKPERVNTTQTAAARSSAKKPLAEDPNKPRLF